MADNETSFSTISDKSKVQLGLTIGLCTLLVGGTVAIYGQISSLRQESRAALDAALDHYVSKELFTTQVDSMRRENRLQFDSLEAGQLEMKATLQAFLQQGHRPDQK